jgi:hypothetical protein
MTPRTIQPVDMTDKLLWDEEAGNLDENPSARQPAAA